MDRISEARLYDVDGTSRVNKACVNADWYNSIAAQITTDEEILGLVGLLHLVQPEFALEIGTSVGWTALQLGKALERNGHGVLYTLENDEEAFNAAVENLEGMENVVPVMCDAAKFNPGQLRFQFAFFDWDKKEEYDKLYARYHHYMDVGAIVAFHDTGSFWVQARAALGRIENMGWVKFIHMPTPRGLSIGQVLS